MNIRISFPVRLIGISIVLFALRAFISSVYGAIFDIIVNAVLALTNSGFHVEPSEGEFVAITMSFIPFLALMLATPSLKPSFRIKAILLGLCAVSFLDVAQMVLSTMNSADPASVFSVSSQSSSAYTMYRGIKLALPIIMWLTAIKGDLSVIVESGPAGRKEKRRASV